MIKEASLQKPHLAGLKNLYPKLDSRLFEKTTRALKVLESMRQSGRPFIFKGGTALMLLLQEPTRLSIDLDIILEEERTDLSEWIESFLPVGYRLEKRNRAETGIPKGHYKIYYYTVLDGEPVEDNILIDVLFEHNRYARVVDTQIKLPFLAMEGDILKVRTPDLSSILGDKMTAFGPRTLGVPYKRANNTPSQLEVVKQMHDVAAIISRLGTAIDMYEVRNTYYQYVAKEAEYRDTSYTPDQTLKDAYETALCLITNGNAGDKEAYPDLKKGRDGLAHYLFADTYGRGRYVTDATKVCWLATVLALPEDKHIVRPNDVEGQKPKWPHRVMKSLEYDAPETLAWWVAIQQMTA